MKWWSEFLRKRRQSDRVKLIVVFFVTGIFFAGDFIYKGIGLYKILNSPFEYVLSSVSENVTNAQLDNLADLKDVKAASGQKEYFVTLKYQDAEADFKCIELSADYLSIVYGIQNNDSMKVFYLNQAAYDQMYKTKENEKRNETNSLTVDYTLEGPEEGGKKKRKAKIVLLEEQAEKEEPCVFCTGHSAEMSGKTKLVRIQIRQQEFSEMKIEQLRQMKFEVINSEEIKWSELQRDIQVLQMRYDFLLSMLSFLFVVCLNLKRIERLS